MEPEMSPKAHSGHQKTNFVWIKVGDKDAVQPITRKVIVMAEWYVQSPHDNIIDHAFGVSEKAKRERRDYKLRIQPRL